MNANFRAVETEVDDNDDRITANTEAIADNQADMLQNADDIAANERSINQLTPGDTRVRFRRGNITTTIPGSTCSPLRSVTCTPPADGYVMIIAAGTISITSTAGNGGGEICLDLVNAETECSGCAPGPNTPSDYTKTAFKTYIPNDFPSTGLNPYGIGFSIVDQYNVTGGEETTFYLNGYVGSGIGSAELFQTSLMAVFFPLGF